MTTIHVDNDDESVENSELIDEDDDVDDEDHDEDFELDEYLQDESFDEFLQDKLLEDDEQGEMPRDYAISEEAHEIVRSCDHVLLVRENAERAALAVCMGQHVRLGGGSTDGRPSAIYSLPALAMSHMANVFMQDFKEKQRKDSIQLRAYGAYLCGDPLQDLKGALSRMVQLSRYEPICWADALFRGERDSKREVLVVLFTALRIGLGESEDSDSIVSQMCLKIQSMSCHLLYDIATHRDAENFWAYLETVRYCEAFFPKFKGVNGRQLMLRAKLASGAGPYQKMWARALLTDLEDDKYTVNGEEDFIPSPKLTGDKAGMIHKKGRKGRCMSVFIRN